MELLYSVKRSAKRKRFTLTVERDRSVIVHAPAEATDETIARVVESRRQWVYEKTRHIQKYQERPHPPGKEFVNGESVLYLGRHYQIQMEPGPDESIRFNQRFIIPASKRANRKEVMREWYIAKAEERILPRVVRHATALGVRYGRARIVDQRYRWGSCTVNDNINLNWRLIKAPVFVIDYVVVHELAHLMEANHTPRFWNIVRTQVPRTEKARAWLRENGHILEENV